MGTFYDVLGVRRESTADEIKQAYHRLALEYHPDKNPSPAAAEKMKEINEAYRILGDTKLRAEYDAKAFRPASDNLYARWYRPRSGGFGQGSGAAGGYQARPPPRTDGFGQGSRADSGYKARPPPRTDGFGEGHGADGGDQAESPPRTTVHEPVPFFSREHLVATVKAGLAFGIAITAAFDTIIFESVPFFSREHLVPAVKAGLAFGIAIVAAFVILGVGTIQQKYGAGVIVAFDAAAAFLPPFVSVLLLRNKLNDRVEAGFYGSVTLAFALPCIYLVTGSDWGWCISCCALPVLCAIVGWLIGRFVGRGTWDFFASKRPLR